MDWFKVGQVGMRVFLRAMSGLDRHERHEIAAVVEFIANKFYAYAAELRADAVA